MTETEVKHTVGTWYIGSSLVFKYRREFVPVEYVILTRLLDNEFKCEDKSTIDLGILDLEDVESILRRNILIPITVPYYTDLIQLKTKGCTCGQWATSNPDMHYRGCALYRDW